MSVSYAFSPFVAVTATITSVVMRMPDSPEVGGRQNFVRTRQNLFSFFNSELGKCIWGIMSLFFRPAVNLDSPSRDSHAIVSNEETQLNASENLVLRMELLWLPAMVLRE